MKIVLEPVTLEHLSYIMSWINDKESLHYFANLSKQISEEEESKYLETILKSKNDYLYSMFLIQEDGSKVYIGQTSINQIYWGARSGRLFIYIKKEFRMMGLGKDCIEAIETKAFAELFLHKLWLILRSHNQAYKGYEAMGYKIEGELIDEYNVNGKYYDMKRLYKINPITINGKDISSIIK